MSLAASTRNGPTRNGGNMEASCRFLTPCNTVSRFIYGCSTLVVYNKPRYCKFQVINLALNHNPSLSRCSTRMKMLKYSMIAKVLKGLSFSAVIRVRRGHSREFNEEESEPATRVPEGHFAVVAVKGEETKRFIVKLDYLSDPAFLRLLELAREEYGFGQKGALALPCKPQELQNILQNRMR